MGAGFLWISLIYLGLSYAHNLKVRAELLEKTCMLIRQMIIETEYLSLPIYDLLCKLSQNPELSSLCYINETCELVKNREDFPIAWRKSVNKTSLKYKSEEKEKLLLLGENIGKYNLDGQLSVLKIYSAYFDAYSKDAKTKLQKYGNMSAVLGALVGSMLFILLI